jgi:xylulokinase
MRQHLHCGIDLGSTNIKVVLIDDNGRSLSSRSVSTPRLSDGTGVVTDAAMLVALLERMILEAWREAGAGAPLRSVTVAGVGEDGLGIRKDLRPTGLSIPWFDRRAEAEARSLRNGAVGDARVGIAIGPDRTAAKWLWLKHNKPLELAEARYWVALTDYPSVWWTGRPFMSNTLAARTACYDVFSREWLTQSLHRVGAPPLPPLLRAGDVIGTVTRGDIVIEGAADENTAVVVGGHDHPIAAFAIRNLVREARVDSMGTANLVYGEAAGPNPPYLDQYLAFSVPPRSEVGVSCLGVFELSASLKRTVADGRVLMAMLAEKRLPSSPLPARAEPQSEVAATRSRLEYASFYARRMFEAMDHVGAPDGPVFSTGGWANSRAFLELRASVFAKPILVIDEPELTAVGCACVGASFSTGISPDLRETRALQQIDPVESWSKIYEDAYPEMTRIIDRHVMTE